MLLPDGGCML